MPPDTHTLISEMRMLLNILEQLHLNPLLPSTKEAIMMLPTRQQAVACAERLEYETGKPHVVRLVEAWAVVRKDD